MKAAAVLPIPESSRRSPPLVAAVGAQKEVLSKNSSEPVQVSSVGAFLLTNIAELLVLIEVCLIVKAVASSDKETVTTGVTTRGGLCGKLNKVVLAYSGELNTSVIVPWLRLTAHPPPPSTTVSEV
ncbi:Argininosuccinate synthase, chloroplastic [Linum perenne]